MRPPLAESADLQGSIQAAISASPAYLFADETRLYLRAPLTRYRFVPDEVVAIVEDRARSIEIRHTRRDYPAKIVFSSTTMSASAMRSIVANKGFMPAAGVEDIPVRSGIPVRLVATAVTIIAMLLSIWLLFGNLFELDRAIRERQNFGNWQLFPVAAIFSIAMTIRFFPPIQWLVIRSGRHIGEIAPLLELVMLLAFLIGTVGIMIFLNIPEIVAIVLMFCLFWAIAQLDLRFFP